MNTITKKAYGKSMDPKIAMDRPYLALGIKVGYLAFAAVRNAFQLMSLSALPLAIIVAVGLIITIMR